MHLLVDTSAKSLHLATTVLSWLNLLSPFLQSIASHGGPHGARVYEPSTRRLPQVGERKDTRSTYVQHYHRANLANQFKP